MDYDSYPKDYTDTVNQLKRKSEIIHESEYKKKRGKQHYIPGTCELMLRRKAKRARCMFSSGFKWVYE